MNASLVCFAMGSLGMMVTDSVEARFCAASEDTCTPAVVCQVSSVINGSWTVGGAGVSKPGKCACLDTTDPPTCVTVHCDVNITVTCTGGGSWKVTGTGTCFNGQPSKTLRIRNCGGGDAAMFMIYQGAGCQGSSVWHTYAVSCGAGDCGSFVCPSEQ